AYLRSHGEETILCIFNLARAPQAVELDLSGFKGRVPVELFGRSAFPPIGDLPYLLTLPGHGFYWFLLDSAPTDETGWRASAALPELITMVMSSGWTGSLDHHNRRLFESEVIPAFLPNQRWFAGKDRRIAGTKIVAAPELLGGESSWRLALLDVDFRDGGSQRYFLPLALTWEEESSEQRNALLPSTLAKARRGRREGAIYDAVADQAFALALVRAMGEARELSGYGGMIKFERTNAFESAAPPPRPTVKRIGGEQSNSSILIEEYGVLKLYRRLAAGIQPETEMARFLTEVAQFPNTPPVLGALRFIEGDEEIALGVLFAFVRNQGEAWTQALNYLTRYLDEALLMMPHEARPMEPATPEASAHPLYLELASQLGQRTAELHRALCPTTPVDAAFAPEPISRQDLARWRERAVDSAGAMLGRLAQRRDGLPPPAQALVDRLLQRREALTQRLAALLPARVRAVKTRFHGDYHLGQVLAVQNDFSIIDFEGEPLRAIAERRQKSSPLRDVAGMLRSYAYASATAVRQMAEIQPAALPVLQERAEEWRRQVTGAFMERYRAAMAETPSMPAERAAADALLDFFTLEKAVYEIDYELVHRPAWVTIPLADVVSIIDPEGGARGSA
ncbi:MAG TPA: putative maltokinase, partial [Stellaceae bacterium]|nr:putative maltokinase [Stellaceae bacterium]